MLTGNLDFGLRSLRGEVRLGPVRAIWCDFGGFSTRIPTLPPCPAGQQGPKATSFL